MTFSEIHGKPTTIDSEDLLTSDIFGCCYFLEYRELLEHVLQEALHFNSKDKLCINEPVISDEYFFWTKFRIGNSQTEPDVLILLRHPGYRCTLILIEAKYNSEKSSEADYSVEYVTDQLARELMVIENQKICRQNSLMEGFELASEYLIYVTAHDVIPEKELKNSASEFFKKMTNNESNCYNDIVEVPLYWLPWWKIEQLISMKNLINSEIGIKNRVLKHIRDVLRTKRLCRFYGVNPLCFNLVPYRFCTFGKVNRYGFGLEIPEIKLPFGADHMSKSEFTEQLDKSLKNLISFFQELSSFMRECDRLMEEEGYTTFNGKTVAYEQSRSVDYPESWFPSYLSRMYYLKKQAEKEIDSLLFINIILRYGSGGCSTIKMFDNVPLIVAGLIVPNTPRLFNTNIVWVTKSWFWAKEPKDNALDQNISEVRTITPKKGEYEDSRFIKTFAYPLENIRGSEELRTKIIERLLKIVENVPETEDSEVTV